MKRTWRMGAAAAACVCASAVGACVGDDQASVVVVEPDASADGSQPPAPDTGSGDVATSTDTGSGTDTASGADTGQDTGADTGQDTGIDASSDTGTDTGSDTGTDAGTDTGTDAGSDAAPCNLTGAFSQLTAVPGLPQMSALGRFSHDELEAYFSLTVDGGDQSLYVATRNSATGTFGSASQITGTSMAGYDDAAPALGTDELTLYFGSTSTGTASGDIYYASRATTGAAFSGHTAVSNVNDPLTVDRYPFIASDKSLWFASGRIGAGTEDIYRAAWNGVAFDAPALVPVSSPTVTDSYPTLTADLLTLYFTRYEDYYEAGVPQRDVWTAQRVSTSAPFGTPTRLAFNTTSDERSAWVSPDGCRLYVATGTSGTPLTMLVASRPAQ